MNTWEKFAYIEEYLGTEETLLAIAKGIGDWELDEMCDYIIRVYDIELPNQ